MSKSPFPRLAPLFSRLHPKRSGGAPWILTALVALLGCCLLATGASAAAKPQPKHPPKPIYWGAWVGDQITGTDAPWDMGGVGYLEALLGKGMSLVEFSSSWQVCGRAGCEPYDFPLPAMDNIRAHGSIPVYSWGAESSPRSSESQPEFQLANIIGGAYDAYIAQFAAEARAWGHPFFLRPNWEMNGSWFPWSELSNGNSPGQYVAAWRRIHDIFVAAGASNATWVWCPYADTEKQLKKTPLKSLYPGNGYVDWTCLDAYNWGRNAVNPKPWRSFDELFSPAYEIVTKKVAPKKPLMLGEFATSPNGGHKAAWIRKMFEQLPRKYPRVRALIYFNTVDRGIDWPLETSPAAAKAFAKGIRKGIYANNRFAGLAGSPIPPLR
ncbi:MAG TPA: glycosyl hydrolase [Solirubrobacterales bacterium]|nr:glycosyl hydrolase [Solirubrobacterales bacterium]